MKINYNMRCIEMLLCLSVPLVSATINYNMRCIEISMALYHICGITDKLQHEMY